jgi:hypothetical protein
MHQYDAAPQQLKKEMMLQESCRWSPGEMHQYDAAPQHWIKDMV